MSDPYAYDSFLTDGVLSRRLLAWLADIVLIAVISWALFWLLLVFGLVTLGLGFGAMSLLPFVPFVYNLVSLLTPRSATPGQRLLGLTVRRNDDLGPPTGLQALLWTLGYYLTMLTCGLLLLVALFTLRKRTLHDLVSGLVVVRVRAMDALTAAPGPWNMYHGTSAPPI